jgi:hypothetical protein
MIRTRSGQNLISSRSLFKRPSNSSKSKTKSIGSCFVTKAIRRYQSGSFDLKKNHTHILHHEKIKPAASWKQNGDLPKQTTPRQSQQVRQGQKFITAGQINPVKQCTVKIPDQASSIRSFLLPRTEQISRSKEKAKSACTCISPRTGQHQIS